MPDAEELLALVSDLMPYLQDFNMPDHSTLLLRFKDGINLGLSGLMELLPKLLVARPNEASAQNGWLRLWWD
jgi:hypothetical protein